MVDADILDNGTRFPNLAQMKMSAFCKNEGHKVYLVLHDELEELEKYDILIISKVFTYTKLPNKIIKFLDRNELHVDDLNNSVYDAVKNYSVRDTNKPVVLVGGTGFFSDGGRDLDEIIEHSTPDYNLYNGHVARQLRVGKNKKNFIDYTNASIGFLTRGCFRKCEFCVNKKYDRAFLNSPLMEFYDETRRFISLSDDNFLSYSGWESLLNELKDIGKPFQFKQGLDIRLLTEKKAKILAECRYRGDYIFAFDHIHEKKTIIKKLGIWRRYCNKGTKLYVLCAFEPQNIWDGKSDITELEVKDIEGTFERIKILMRFKCLPYIMRYEFYKKSQFRSMYTQIARWCNQPNIFKKMSFREFCDRNQIYHKSDTECAALRAMNSFEAEYPEIADRYFDVRYDNYE